MRFLCVVPAVPLRLTVLFAVFVFVCAPAAAQAATTLAGDKDTSPPLVVDPGSENPPITFSRNPTIAGQVEFPRLSGHV